MEEKSSPESNFENQLFEFISKKKSPFFFYAFTIVQLGMKA